MFQVMFGKFLSNKTLSGGFYKIALAVVIGVQHNETGQMCLACHVIKGF